ncbi:MAG: DUF5333 domain-containing protein [Paracoccaceae bacterium]|nr:DUF5333 domain-containing protein [Paracoccaceae bacterium]
MRARSAFVIALTVSASLALPAAAKPPLRDVAEIDDGLMAVAIADEIRKTCDDISARMFRAMATLSDLKSRAKSLGYSEEEIEDYVTSKAEKTRMRAKAEAFLADQGVDAKSDRELCRFGKKEIARTSDIGRLLR